MILYTAADGSAAIRLRAEDGTVWLTQLDMAELFAATKQNISLHIRNILTEGELNADAVVKESLTVQNEGQRAVRRSIQLYNLDMILAVGYRVRSPRGAQFRQWASTHLKQYLIKGFVMDDERLKNPGNRDYFDELLARIRDIRASEKRFCQKIRDIYTTAVDYDKHSDAARVFFKKVQNKMLWAVTGQTAAELIANRADAAQPNMGLTAFKGERVRRDVAVAKNYLAGPKSRNSTASSSCISTMPKTRRVGEDQARRRNTMTMQDWAGRLDAFLRFNEREILTHAGKVQAAVAEKLALERYARFDAKRRQAERLATDAEDLQQIEDLSQIETLGRKPSPGKN